ncbi:c-di-GMP-binding flagellar brake protein YcgR [Herbinix hemicellulosilytica]|uniref:C-di-GMP-binding flagellar brake protein YcgR n=1 Tax=Herbinix hemicellulosilytica TaxID=1564487 RepID=A0A0H5SW48_HERHM|nr:flagellar brake domain-containing protein [Herbinix hemicellulosilytica]RBP60848.1 c-di-GMP-binding flagellar brake protein YcgR [Herbinix hemicellulosilytica]CRZ34543.1 hypothetical protein HHT355_1342 [Herbinix hemicellulosilytica]
MLRDLVKIGDKVELKQLDQKGNLIKSANTYVSQVVDFGEEGTICLASPIKNGLLVILNKWVSYRLYFYTEKGLYQCNGHMLNIYREKNMPMVIMKLTSDLEKVQRRKYFRLECVHDILYRRITEEELTLEQKLIYDNSVTPQEQAEIRKKLAEITGKWTNGCITDLSGGGCRFNSKEELKPGDKILLKLSFTVKNQLKKLEITSVIIASEKMYRRTGFYEHRVEFEGISPKDREDLIKYIFEQERKRRSNEKK